MLIRLLHCMWLPFLAALASSSVIQVLAARAETIWQIGSFDESSAEYLALNTVTGKPRKVDYANPKEDPIYTIGKSRAESDWLPFQPGTSNGSAGHRAHPFTIQFELPQLPHGSYSLKLSLLAYSPRLPNLQVDINGHRGWFYQHPKLSYNAGDQWVFYLPYYSTSELACDLPARFLVKGRNRLVLTAVDDPEERDDSRISGFPWPGSSGIIYDALALEHHSNSHPPQVPPWKKGDPRSAGARMAQVVPTIYYRSRNSQLVELVDVFVRFAQRPTGGQVSLTIGENRFVQSFNSDRDFGEQRLEFEVPELTGTQSCQLTVRSNGHSSRLNVNLTPAKKWTIFVAPNEHLDIGYTDYDSKVAELHSRTVDDIIKLTRHFPAFRFTLDGSWIVEQFLNGRSQEQLRRFFDLVAARKIFVPANYASTFTGFASLENLIRSLYYSKDLLAQHHGDFDFALISDVPSYSWSYASVLAAAGLKYFVAASDAYRAPFLLYNQFHSKSPQWWEGPDGGRILTWYSRHYHQVGSLFGMPPKILTGHESLPRFLQIYDQPSYNSDAVILFGTQVENTALYPEQASLADEWNKAYSFPKLVYSGFSEALAYITKQQGDRLPVVRGDGGPYWEDGLGANAFITAVSRENQQRVLSAEKISTLSSLLNPVVRPDREVLDKLWRELLVIDEHSWQADRSTTDPESYQAVHQGAVKDARATGAKRMIDYLLGRGFSAIADLIDRPKGTLVVFNPLNWQRSDFVTVEIEKGVSLIDLATNQSVSFELLLTSASYQRIRFVASDVPSLGYKCYALKSADAGVAAAPASNPAPELENSYYRVALDASTGSVRTIFDKELNRELVDASSPYRFNQYLYVTGADKLPNRLVQCSTTSPVPVLNIHASSQGRIVSLMTVPSGTVARLESSGFNTPLIETEIILPAGQKKIQFVNRIEKKKVYSKEGVYFVFPFAMQNPQFRYSIQNGFVDPSKDLLPGAGREWFSVQHWVEVKEREVSAALVPVDAPLITLGDIARGTWPKEFGQRQGTVFSYVMNNYTPEGYLAGQGGEFTFRYTLTSGNDLDLAKLGHLGWEAMSPLEVNEIRPNDKVIQASSRLNSVQTSLLQIDQLNVSLITWKLAENGEGTILRFLELSGGATKVRVTVPIVEVESAWLCNAVEDNQKALPVFSDGFFFEIKPFQIVTVRLKTKEHGS